MDELSKSFLTVLMAAIMFVLLVSVALLATAFHAVILTDYWTWFVVPLGVPPINIWTAFGLMLIAAMLKHGLARRNAPKLADGFRKVAWDHFMFNYASAAIAWGVAYLVAGQL